MERTRSETTDVGPTISCGASTRPPAQLWFHVHPSGTGSSAFVRVSRSDQRTCRQVSNSEAVLDEVAGLAVPPTLQAGVLLQRRLQHVVAAQALKKRVSRC